MNVFYEEDGGFKVASVMQETDASLQVESVSGKRSKIKSANVLLRFESALASFMDAANLETETLDTDFLWEASGVLTSAEFNFADLAQDYYGGKPTAIQQAAMAIKLHAAPMYFYRKGKGVYKAAPPETLKAAMAGVEKKRLQAEQVANWVTQLQAGELPAGFSDKARQLLYAPDKNSLEWKAIDQAAQTSGKLAVQVMFEAGLVQSAHDYHLGAFLFEMFKQGTDFGQLDFGHLETVKYAENLPIADVKAFSIDDATTTEIDDAFSLEKLDNGNTRIGIHIAAPALGVLPNSPLDEIVRNRLSTVYMPGNKITMLPEAAIRPFSLDAGETKPALSLYCELNAAFEMVKTETKVELITIADNLRHDSLEPFFNENTLLENSGHPYWPQLKTLFDWAESLEKARGKANPNAPKQIDYNFYVTDGIVKIVPRERGSPMDKLVAELMIFANSHWGGMLKDAGMAGIYRAQTGGKVFMTTHAEPHQGLGVAQYAWSTSPLRRAVDLINQRQIMACAQQTTPPYAPKAEALKVIMRDFDQTYSAYSDFQTRMERFWCLQYLIQEYLSKDQKEITAVVWRDNLVKIDGMFYVTKVPSLPERKVGSKVELTILHVDTLLMELGCKYVGDIEAEIVETPVDDSEQVIEI